MAKGEQSATRLACRTRCYPSNASVPKRDTWHTFLQEGRHTWSLNHLKTYEYRKEHGYSEQELDIPVWGPCYPRKVNHLLTLQKNVHSSLIRDSGVNTECLVLLTFKHKEISVSSLGTLQAVHWTLLTEGNTERVSFQRTSYSFMGLL